MKIEYLTEPNKSRVEKLFGLLGKRILVSEGNCVTVPSYRHWQQRYKLFNCRQSDVWVVSFPKSGTTWTQEMVWCIMNDYDYATADESLLMKRFPFFEWDGLLPEDMSTVDPMKPDDPCAIGETWKILHTIKDPRAIKSHLHLELLPDDMLTSKSKVIYVCRDPRDVIVSYYYHSKKLDGFIGTFGEFFDLFLEDLLFFSPYWKHILDFWKIRDKENVLIIRYEELKQDLPAGIKKVAGFLGRNVPESELGPLVERLSFSKMKTNRSVNNEALLQLAVDGSGKTIPFMRSGVVGEWKSHMTEEQIKKMKVWTEENLKDTDFPFYRDY